MIDSVRGKLKAAVKRLYLAFINTTVVKNFMLIF